MTRHRLIRCDLDRLAGCARQLHPDLDGVLPDETMRWFSHRVPSGVAALSWSARGPVGALSCCLEVERGACGVLVHLTVTPLLGPRSLRSRRVTRGLTEIWAARQLASLSRLVDATSSKTSSKAA
jgi:hypothetical protein